MEDTKLAAGKKDDPADVARDAFEALMAGEEKVVASSARTKAQAAAAAMLPDAAKAEMQRKQAEPGSPDKDKSSALAHASASSPTQRPAEAGLARTVGSRTGLAPGGSEPRGSVSQCGSKPSRPGGGLRARTNAPAPRRRL